MRIVLISCASTKLQTRKKAKDLYQSPLFKKSLAYAYTLKPEKIYVLSAFYHLLELEQEIDPYNVTLSSVPPKKRTADLKVLTSVEKKEWGRNVLSQLAYVSSLKDDHYTILAGSAYTKPLVHGIKNYEEPLKGLGQGKRLSLLNKLLGDNVTIKP